jgi:hypothetical protein
MNRNRMVVVRACGSRLCLGVGIALALAAAACSNGPTGPSVFEAGRRVLGGSGGGAQCPGGPCPTNEINGTVEIIAGGGTLTGQTLVQRSSDPSRFAFTGTSLTGTGRFETGGIRAFVSNNTVTIDSLLNGGANGTSMGETGVTAPATIELLSDPSCAVLVVTTMKAQVENFGPTTIVERHCAT